MVRIGSIYLGSISKTLVPGLRVAWIVAPAAIAEKIELAKQATDLCTGVFDQRVVHAALEQGLVAALAPRLRKHYQDKRDVMETALRDLLPGRVRWGQPRGGFFLWAEFAEGIDDRALFERAVDLRVSFVVGSAFYVDGQGHRFARLSFSAPTHERIREGIRRLGAAVQALQADEAGSQVTKSTSFARKPSMKYATTASSRTRAARMERR